LIEFRTSTPNSTMDQDPTTTVVKLEPRDPMMFVSLEWPELL